MLGRGTGKDCKSLAEENLASKPFRTTKDCDASPEWHRAKFCFTVDISLLLLKILGDGLFHSEPPWR